MEAKTHLMFALVASIIVVYFIPQLLFYVPLILFGSLLPDIDHPNSKLGRKIWPISKLINWVFGHRGFLHSIFFVLLISIPIGIYFGFSFGFAIAIGILSHLLSDALTVSGIALFYPLSNFKIKGFVRTGSWLEYIIYLSLYLLAGFIFYNLI